MRLSPTEPAREPMRQLPYVLVLGILPQVASAACLPIKAETDIVGIRIGDAASSARVLGAAAQLPSEQDKDAAGADKDFPFVRLTSADGKQEAKLFMHYGDEAGSYNEIEVRLTTPANAKGKRLAVPVLATERGIRLGLREAELTRTLGSCFRRQRGKRGETVIRYEITDPGHRF